jgi:hypothetical protein
MAIVLIDNDRVLLFILDFVETICGLLSIFMDSPNICFANVPYRNTRPH